MILYLLVSHSWHLVMHVEVVRIIGAYHTGDYSIPTGLSNMASSLKGLVSVRILL